MSLNIEENIILIIAAIILVFITIGFLFYYYSDKQRIIRSLSKLKTLNTISSFKQNQLTKITGKAREISKPLIAPFSKRKCVFYIINVKEEKGDEDNSHWKTIFSEEKIQDFFVEKNGEYAIIKPTKNPKNYLSYLVKDKEVSSGAFNDPSPKFEAFLKTYNIKSTGFLGFNKQLKCTEGIIEVGEEITVAGIAKWKELTEKIEGYSYSKIASLESNDNQRIIITDLPKNKFNKRR